MEKGWLYEYDTAQYVLSLCRPIVQLPSTRSFVSTGGCTPSAVAFLEVPVMFGR